MVNIKNSVSLEHLASINNFKGKTFVIKYGGSIMQNKASKKAFLSDIAILKKLGINIVIVHGGGPEISKWIKKVGVEPKFYEGLRITDDITIEIAEMVLSGKINKDLTSLLCSKDIEAVGLSGKDNNLLEAEKKYLYKKGEKIDIGYVGNIVNVNKKFLLDLISSNKLPVISPIASDKLGNTYNINADFVAAAISSSIKADKLILMTDIDGVYMDINDPSSLISSLSTQNIESLIKKRIIKGGMIPKMQCSINAIKKGTKAVHLIDGRKEHSLLNDLFKNCGTKILSGGEFYKCQKVM